MKSFLEKIKNQNITGKILIIVCMALLLGLFFTYLYYIPLLKNGTTARKNYPLLNPSLDLYGKKDMIVDFLSLRQSLIKKYQNRDDYLVSIYFEYLPTGANISVNKDSRIWPASLIKIPVAMAAMKKVEDGDWQMSNELVIMDEDKDDAYGEMYKEPTGTTHTVKEFLEKSLINSDNTAHFVLLRNIDNSELEEVYEHLGLDDVIEALKKAPKDDEADNRITAKRYTTFFRSLYSATFLNREYSERFLDILGQAPRDLLGKGIPDDVRFVHKTGIRTDEAVTADSGIVYVPGRPYLLTVMIEKKDKASFKEGEADKLFQDISEEIYTYVAHAH